MRRKPPPTNSATPKETDKKAAAKKPSAMGNQEAKPGAKPAAAQGAAPHQEGKGVTPVQLSSALEKVMAHSLQNKPGTPEYDLKHAKDQLVELQGPITTLGQSATTASGPDIEKLHKEALLLDERCMKILLSLDNVQGEVYREQRRATVKEVQQWQARLDEAKKVLSDRRAAM